MPPPVQQLCVQHNFLFRHFIIYIQNSLSIQLHFHTFHQICFIHFQPTITFSYISSNRFYPFSAVNYIFMHFIIYDLNIFSRQLHFHTFHQIRFIHFQSTITFSYISSNAFYPFSADNSFSYISSYTILSFSAENYIFIHFIIYDFIIFSRKLHLHKFHHILLHNYLFSVQARYRVTI